jgi:hypothetical protein
LHDFGAEWRCPIFIEGVGHLLDSTVGHLRAVGGRVNAMLIAGRASD